MKFALSIIWYISDVKPSNILLDEKGSIKLCDFGISGRLVDSKAKTRSAGCAAYMAPERIDPPDPSKPDYDIRADVWSLGEHILEKILKYRKEWSLFFSKTNMFYKIISLHDLHHCPLDSLIHNHPYIDKFVF